MPTIVYCYHLPSHDQPNPPLVWDAFEADGEPRNVGIVPKLLKTDDEQHVFRSIAPFLNEVVAVQGMRSNITAAERARIIAAGQHLPRTFIADSYSPADRKNGTFAFARTQGLDFKLGLDRVVQLHAVRKTLQHPNRKCVDLVAVHEVQERIEQRRAERRNAGRFRGPALPWAEPANERPSIYKIPRSYLEHKLVRVHLSGEYTDKLPIIPLAPKLELNTGVQANPSEEREILAEARKATVYAAADVDNSPPPEPTRPPHERAFAGKAAPDTQDRRMWWMDRD